MKRETTIKLPQAIAIIAIICAFQSSDAATNRSNRSNRSVTVNNTAANPVPVTVQNPTTNVVTTAADNPAFQPFLKGDIHTHVTPRFDSITFSVPAGKILVIEVVSLHVLTDGASPIASMTLSQAGGFANTIYLTLTPQGNNVFNATNAFRAYAIAGADTISINLDRVSTASEVNWAASIGGYLVDAP